MTIEFVIWIVRGLKLFANKWYLTSLFTITPSSDMFMFSAQLLILSPLSKAACPWLIVRIILITKDNSLDGKTQFFNTKIVKTIFVFELTAIAFGMFQFILIKL